MAKKKMSFTRNCKLSFKVAAPFCTVLAMNESSCCSTSLSAFGVVGDCGFDLPWLYDWVYSGVSCYNLEISFLVT
jgi:hypothetical protein